MHSPSKILVPVDFTDSSRAALEYAATLGARFGAEGRRAPRPGSLRERGGLEEG